MLRRYLPVIALALAALACNTLGGGAVPTEINVSTAAAQTATALVPTVEGEATAAPTVEGEATAAPTAEGEATAAPTVEGEATAEPTAEAEVPATPAGPTCAVAYADYTLQPDPQAPVHTGNLYCLSGDGTPQVLATANQPFDPVISPDGTLIAFTVVSEPGINQLWVVSAAGGDARLLVGQEQLPSDGTVTNSPQRYAWLAGTHILVFDTRYLPVGGPFGPGEYINADLWTVDADNGATHQILPNGAAGSFSVSPDGQTVAISRGTGLDLVNADGSNYRQDVITYPFIMTYSEYTYKPVPQWSTDGTFFNVSVPSNDPMAADASAALYRVGVDGVVTPLANIAANIVFGGVVSPPQYAPNGQFMFYSLGNADGTGEVLHQVEFLPGGGVGERTMGPTLFLRGYSWSPDSTYFAYSVTPTGAPGQGYVTGTTAESVQTFANGLTAIRALEWEDGDTLVFLGSIGPSDTWSLYRQTLGSEPALLASGLGEQVTMDVHN